ncbi:2,3-diaminopropionate biosynthesis protein SbnB [Tenacibaculum aiptasiae]|uniref:2,3-diaminopropionate biosynthesis protein SbnB n=1 Tax=Tenacibaculum aiptasiae TaxID=426481 RepID=A0A7J5A806_9FLAO|nr:2,3-diaminopropionate biosynthesis protein SbnB [Tenacibaculum aiptasiae]KAB1153655.1 2,3-diaminopropionate biosynthesis protein SbnB [Tenacibaculum aiptasiae]
MIYLNNKNIQELNTDWNNNVKVITDAVKCLGSNDMAQPIKPYLRYRNEVNRIIAMPAFIGGDINKSGIKWIASFPDNIEKGIARAHSVITLNEAETGVPIGVINSGEISAIRTASVSGFIIKKFIENRKPEKLKIGIIGFGPIGQAHLEMCNALLGKSIEDILIYDLKGIDRAVIDEDLNKKVTEVSSWKEAYAEADIFITCTVSKDRYIDKQPKAGSLHLNVSLRDYKAETFPWFSKAIIVDEWNEVCRENTDIEMFNKTQNLQREDVIEIQELLTKNYFSSLEREQAVMFNPMGMAVFDIAIADNYLKLALNRSVGVLLED